MWSSVKTSLLLQIRLFFILSTLLIVVLWGFFIYEARQKEYKSDIARFFKVARSYHFMAMNNQVRNETLSDVLDMEMVDSAPPKERRVIEMVGDGGRGFEIYVKDGKKYMLINTPKGAVHLRNKKEGEPLYTIHLVFVFLLLSQLLIYLKINSSLRPLGAIHKKLQELEGGDLTSLNEKSNYMEIKRLIESYNTAVIRLKSIIETKEMFNKVFMHEIKTPLAKGMFYVRLAPTLETNKKMENLLISINSQLDEFSRLESAIATKEPSNDINSIKELLEESIKKIPNTKENIQIAHTEGAIIKGHAELWIICFRNLIENGLKYSNNGKIEISYADNEIAFENYGEPLPLNDGAWKIDTSKRHKSSSGYGFGLFIIKTITEIEGYEIAYSYGEKKVKLNISLQPVSKKEKAQPQS